MKITKLSAVLVLILALWALGAVALAAEADSTAVEPDARAVPQVAINVPSDGVLYNERGELVISATLSNVGTQVVPPLDVVVVLLNDCILTSVPQTCRFAAFGSFQGVAPNGIAANNTISWAFNFGSYPRLDLSRWTVIWYPLPSARLDAQAGS